MKRVALCVLAFALAFASGVAGLNATSDAQPMRQAPSPSPSPSPVAQTPSLSAKPTSARVGSTIAFAFAPLAPQSRSITIAYGDGSTGTLVRATSMLYASTVATGTDAYEPRDVSRMRAGDDDFVRYPRDRCGLHGRDDRGDFTRSDAVGTACTKAAADAESIRDAEPIATPSRARA